MGHRFVTWGVLLTFALLCLALPQRSLAAAYLPPAGKLYAGVTAGDPLTYEQQTHTHAAIFQEFITWGGTIEWAFAPADQNLSRMMLAIQTITPPGGEVISPGAIARGGGDGWIEWLGAYLARRGQPVYLRLFAEMDAYWNPYSAYNENGGSRGPDHSTRAFRQAWRRITLILRGGAVRAINAKLNALRMPAVAAVQRTLPRAPVAMLWVPQVWGAPDIPQNEPREYYPGARYVDWVGTDFYSKYPNWRGLNDYFQQFRGKPFVFGEWAIMGADSPRFVNELFGWVRSHRRVRILMYNQGYKVAGPLALEHYPASAQTIARHLRNSLFASFAPEWALTPNRGFDRESESESASLNFRRLWPPRASLLSGGH
jgi:hypothetical protein